MHYQIHVMSYTHWTRKNKFLLTLKDVFLQTAGSFGLENIMGHKNICTILFPQAYMYKKSFKFQRELYMVLILINISRSCCNYYQLAILLLLMSRHMTFTKWRHYSHEKKSRTFIRVYATFAANKIFAIFAYVWDVASVYYITLIEWWKEIIQCFWR